MNSLISLDIGGDSLRSDRLKNRRLPHFAVVFKKRCLATIRRNSVGFLIDLHVNNIFSCNYDPRSQIAGNNWGIQNSNQYATRVKAEMSSVKDKWRALCPPQARSNIFHWILVVFAMLHTSNRDL
jgi:hypothetical protein